MTRVDLIAKMRAILVRRRESIRRLLAGDVDQYATSRDSYDVGDESDSAFESIDDEIRSRTAISGSQELRQISLALESMERGDYGMCEECGAPISTARLMALPYTTVCIACQRNSETGSSRRAGRQADSYSMEDSDDNADL